MSRSAPFAFVVAFALSACGIPAKPTSPPVMDYAALVEALRSGGAEPSEAGAVDQPFFTTPGRVVGVAGLDLQVFEYPDEASRKADSDRIAADGSAIGTTMVDWIAPPTFWAKGRLIVLALGADRATVGLVTSVMGDPVAGG